DGNTREPSFHRVKLGRETTALARDDRPPEAQVLDARQKTRPAAKARVSHLGDGCGLRERFDEERRGHYVCRPPRHERTRAKVSLDNRSDAWDQFDDAVEEHERIAVRD